METQGHDMGQAVGRGPGGAAPAPATVLVVDSDARALRLLEVGLRQAGYRVNAALSGDDAVAQAEVETPSVAIIDAELHDVDGFGLSARLRAMPGCERLLLLFVVDPRRPSDRLRAFEAGAGDVLERPVHLKEALWRVETLLEKAAQRGELGTAERGMRFFGTLSAISVLDLLQSMELGRRSGLMHCKSARGQRGVLYFADGKLIDAEVGRLRGEDALQRVLTWNDGEYRVDQLTVLRPDRIPMSSSALLLEAAKWVDEWNGLLAALPPLDTVLVPTPIGAPALGGMGSPALSAEVEDVLAACNGQRSVREVVELDEELPLDTLGRLRALSQLVARRLLSPRTTAAPEAARRMSLTPPPAPRLTPSPRLTPPPTPHMMGGPRLTPPIGLPPRLTPPPMPQPGAQARLTPPPGAASARLTPSPLTATSQSAADLSSGVPQYAPQLAQVAHSRPQPVAIAAEHTLPWGAPPPSGPTAARAPAVAAVVAPSSISLPEFSAEILPSGLSHSDSQAAASLSQTSEDVLPVLSASSIEPIESLNHSSAEISGVPSVIVQLQLDAEGKLPPPASRPDHESPAARAALRTPALLHPMQKSAWERLQTPVIGAGLFCLGVGLFWVFQTLTESPASAPSAPAPVASLPLSPPAALPAPPVAAPQVPTTTAVPPPAPTAAPTGAAATPAPTAPEPTAATAAAAAPAPTLPEPAPAPTAAPAPTVPPTGGESATPPTSPDPAAADPARFLALIQKGKQSLARGQFSKTRQTLREAAHLRPQAAEVFSLQADLALDEGDVDNGLRLAKKAVHADPNYADGHLSVAMASQAKADTATARSHFKKYLELAPNGDRAKDVKAILQGRY